MTTDNDTSLGAFSRRTLLILILLAGGLTLVYLTGEGKALLRAILTTLTELSMAGFVVVAGGGFGWLVVRRIAPDSSPTALKVITACGLGLWMLSTAVLVVGSATTGLLGPLFWWPVISVGVILAAWQGRKSLEVWKPPKRSDARALIWVILAVAAGLWLAGATFPTGRVRASESYDVQEYHLQVPREFYNAGHVGELPHNCYSYYPLGVEMLSLLAMALRGGAYDGMYLAKFLHGAFAVLTVGGIFVSLKSGDEARGRFAAVLVGTTPLVIFLSSLAMVEMAVLFYMALAVLWLRQWIAIPSARSAACIGLTLGAACAMKYLSVGFIVAPIAAVMLVSALRSRKRLAHLPLAAMMTLIPFTPWLTRNLVYTRNPVFPLATTILGRGPNWTEESQQRWIDGHGPESKPPVPVPPGYKAPEAPNRTKMFVEKFLLSHMFGPLLVISALVAICALASTRGRGDPWDLSLIGILAVQLAVWVLATHEMPWRFLTPALVPIALLAGGALARLAAVQVNPLKKNAMASNRGPWGLPIACTIFATVVIMNIVTAFNVYISITGRKPMHGVPGELLTWRNELEHESLKLKLPDNTKFLLVGEARGFYFPPNTVYATAFDPHPLAKMVSAGLTPRQIASKLRGRGITHMFVNWAEIWRLAATYGYPASLSAELYERRQKGRRPGLKVLDDLTDHGLRLLRDIGQYQPTTQPANQTKDWLPFEFPPNWPIISIYEFRRPGAAAGATGDGGQPASKATSTKGQ